ncbi:O-antigen ligase family protein [Planctomonas psychrotolerans]|uniref:O-antigen ligase family protein n=1 Tax=Planctomonas psychrotolerans TaxID=2528712 RepID=UPI001D0D08F5|nr:O-antigen ligase family protein [Planctomonas psychrotolerans]
MKTPAVQQKAMLGIALVVNAALTAGIVLAIASSDRSPVQWLILIALAIGLLAGCLMVPISWLPLVALVVFALGPQRLLPDVLQDFPPSAIVLLLWAARKLLTPTSSTAPRGSRALVGGLTLLLLLWMGFSTLFSIDRPSSIVWMLLFATATVPVVFLSDAVRERVVLVRGWSVFGAVLGAYAAVELVLARNIVYGYIYSFFGGDGQHWETYRASASLGSPVFAGMFFACSTAIALAQWASSRSRWGLVLLAANAAGLVATLTRGGYIAVAVAVVVGFLVSAVHRNRATIRVFLAGALVATVGLAVALAVPAVAARLLSTEASGSLTQRTRSIDIVVERSATLPPTGAGPDTSFLAMGRAILDLRFIENSYLQLLLSIGLVGVLLFVALLGAAWVSAFRRRDMEAIMLLTVFGASIGTYNAIDDQHGTVVVLGLVLLVALHGTRDALESPDAAERAGRSAGSDVPVPASTGTSETPPWAAVGPRRDRAEGARVHGTSY